MERGYLSSMLQGKRFEKLTSNFRISLLSDLFLHDLEPLQLSFDRRDIWKGFVSRGQGRLETLLRPTRTGLIGLQQLLQYRGRLLKEAELSQGFAFAELGLNVGRVLREDLSKWMWLTLHGCTPNEKWCGKERFRNVETH